MSRTLSQTPIVVPIALKHTNTATCVPRWFVQRTEYHPVLATYEPLVNGEETFTAVHRAIEQATHSIDIICWGFQPSMFFIRNGTEPCIGELLKIKARSGVQVRVLGWEMIFNLAGLGGEGNEPGRGDIRIKSWAGHTSTPEQRAYDKSWFASCSKPIHPAMYATAGSAALAPGPFKEQVGQYELKLKQWEQAPRFVGRGFNLFERTEIAFQAAHAAADRELSSATIGALFGIPTHHQKSVLIDYDVPERAVGFVMGHNMLDEYWDTDAHSAWGRHLPGRPAPNKGPTGALPRQDISCRVTGPILEHLHHNFAEAWRKETGEDLLAAREAMQISRQLKPRKDQGTPVMAQLLRTQAQENKRDIESLYLHAANNVSQFIYIENQYFRWPPLAELIKNAARAQTEWGRDPGLHGSVHLFVITNATDEGMGAGTVNTHRMLESLGRGDTIPQITKLRRIEQAKAQLDTLTPDWTNLLEHKALRTLVKFSDYWNGTRLGAALDEDDRLAAELNSQHRAQLEEEIRLLQQPDGYASLARPEVCPNLKVHVCSLVAPDSPGDAWMPVYVHSKLMIVDDVFTTQGSANINTRSMQVDSELNIAHEWASVTQQLRRRLWNLHTAGMGAQDDAADAFDAWQEIIDENKKIQEKRESPYASLVEFFYEKNTLLDLD